MTRTRALAAAVLATSITVLAVGCAGQESTTDRDAGHASSADRHAMDVPEPSAGADWNAADATYLTMMLAHHRQAVEMGELARSRAEDPGVAALAEGIEAGQGAEIVTMASWLDRRELPVPTIEEAQGMYGMSGMTGMLTPGQLDELADTSGAEFDRLYLERMIAHHEGALEMAETEMATGQEVTVVDMATEVAATQTGEIARMRELLDQV